MAGLVSVALSPETWAPYAALITANNGVWGGCWCMAFHPEGVGRPGQTPAGNRAAKEARVRAGTAHAALVMDGETCIGWCQFGPTAELPRIKNRRAYEAGQTLPPDWRITCFFTDPRHRGRGVADIALQGAVDQIARAGGGRTEGYPDAVAGRTTSAFLFNGTASSFERLGFARDRPLGKTRWVYVRDIPAA